MRTTLTFNVSSADQGKRLDSFLFEKKVGVSRSQIKKLVDQKLVKVDGKESKGGASLKSGQIIEVNIPGPRISELSKEDIPIEILYEDRSIAVVNKPAGLVVHPAPGHRSGTLVNALLARITDLKTIMGEIRPGIVHRLDKETSGVMVVAKDEHAQMHLGRQFKERLVNKVYNAVVLGELSKDDLISDGLIGRARKDRKKMSVVRDKGREAVTVFKVLERFGGVSFVEARPKTGRTHQIRVHMANLGCPLVGDKLYLKTKMLSHIKDKMTREELSRFPRHALHASRLKFFHPEDGLEVEFTAPMPSDMKDLLAMLREKKK